jgi:hypothetical protein
MQLRKAVKRTRDRQWFCAIRPKDCDQWSIIPNPSDGFYADPFLIEHETRTYLFAERFRFGNPKATIVVGEVNDNGTVDTFRSAVSADVHLSYPHVFQHDGEVYMTPETAGARQVRLYRATDFPHEWEHVGVLLDDVVAVDPTIHVQDGRFYLFCNIAPPGSTCDDELHVFIADNLQGPWRAHPLNPVVSNVLSARPAGRIRIVGNELIRPAQDCSLRYGYAITLNRIDELTETTYRETPIGKILPDWQPNIIGTHMVNETDKFEVRDAQEWRWRWWSYRRR